LKAEKLGSVFTIGFVTVSANVTRSARVSRVNKNHTDTCPPCLVDDKIFQLIKSPVAPLPTHSPRKSRGSLPNTCEVFQGECLTRENCRSHKLFADIVIEPAGVTPRLAAHLLERTLCPFRPRLLQMRTVGADAAAGGFDAFPRIGTPLAVCGNLYDAEVNAENAIRLNQGRVWNAHRCHQVEVTIDKSKVTFALLKGQKPALVFAANKRQFQPSVNRPDAHSPLVCVPAQDTVIVSNRSHRLKRALSALVQFVGIGNFGNGANDHLRGQTRYPAHGGVLPFVQGVLLEGLVLPRPRAEAVTDSVSGLHSSLQSVGLGRRHDQFDLCGKFHYTDIMPAIAQACQCPSNLIGQSLPCMNAKGVSLPTLSKGSL